MYEKYKGIAALNQAAGPARQIPVYPQNSGNVKAQIVLAKS